MNVSQLQNKQIVVLGLGLTGMSFVRFLSAQQLAFAVNDSRPDVVDSSTFNELYPDVYLVQGHWDKALIASADILLVSPGIDLNEESIRQSIPEACDIWGDVELYCRLKNTPTVAVTGSNGKSTVVNLVHHIGDCLGHNTQLGGNVGVPVLDTIDESPELLILELSSFQLETMNSMQAIAGAMLNLSDDHLDRHHTMENYARIKQRIYEQCDLAIYNREDSATIPAKHANMVSFGSNKPAKDQFGLAEHQGQTWLFFGETSLIAISQLPIAGVHNALNCLTALAIGKSVGWSIESMLSAIQSFKALPHRCQPVTTHDGVLWVNDSKATNVGATLAAINGLAPTLQKDQQLILIAGGEGKGADFSPLERAFTDSVDFMFTLGKDGQLLSKLHQQSEHVSTLAEAVQKAHVIARAGDVVLLSPACASIDMFKNFVDRGNAFSDEVQRLQEAS